MSEDQELNVYEEPITPCSTDPATGFRRDGYCRHIVEDAGRHEICAVMTEEFLEYSKERGNDLTTARPEMDFPGLEPGDRWCVCVPRWLEALEDDVAPPVVPEATARSVLTHVPLSTIEDYAHGDDRASGGDQVDGDDRARGGDRE